MKIEDKLINKRFYDYNEGECFVDEYGSYYMKVRVCDKGPEAPVLVSYKAVNLENGYIDEFENAQCFRPVNAKVVIE
jgi:hypothetical protein